MRKQGELMDPSSRSGKSGYPTLPRPMAHALTYHLDSQGREGKDLRGPLHAEFAFIHGTVTQV